VDLKSKRVFITGAANGIGRALTLEFLRRGARVVALDLNADALASLGKETELLGTPIETRAVDVGDRKAFEAALEDLATAGPPAVFVNNAGIAKAGSALEAGPEGFEKTLRVNLHGTATGTFFALRKMRAAGEGTIVNIASLAGLMPAPYLASYAASKYAVVGFTRSLREELKIEGSPVRLCLVCPGFINTAIMRQDGFEFPPSLMWLVPKPDAAAKRIVDAVRWGCEEVTPDAGGKLIRLMNRIAPDLMTLSSRLLLPAPKPRR